LIIFSVGFTPQTRSDILNKVISKNFDEKQKQFIKFYHFPGNVDYNKLHILHRIVLAGKKLIISHKDEKQLTDENIKFLQKYGKNSDSLSMEYTNPLIDYVKHVLIKQK
jgi:hypothetical protein